MRLEVLRTILSIFQRYHSGTFHIVFILFAMQNTRRLFIFGCVLKPAAEGAFQNRKS